MYVAQPGLRYFKMNVYALKIKVVSDGKSDVSIRG